MTGRTIIQWLFFAAFGAAGGFGGSAVMRPEMPPEVGAAVQQAKEAANEVRASLADIRVALTKLEGGDATRARDIDKLERRVEALERKAGSPGR